MSLLKRLTWGLGIMALGVCLALPFRHGTPPEETLAVDPASNQLSLGEGVSLQMPGQTMAAPLASHTPAPWTADEERADAPSTAGAVDAATTPTPPPALADQYHPLFKPSLGADSSGHVVSAGSPPAARKPVKKHTIHDGDTLEALAVRYLGDARRAAEILAANRDVLRDPELLPIGVAITIPANGAPSERSSETAADEPPTLVPLPTDGFRRGR